MSSTHRGSKRSPADYYPTPAWCVRLLLEECDLPGSRWIEPCAGDGSIIRAVNDARSGILWSAMELRPECRADLAEATGHPARVTIGDSIESPARCDVAITNPPFRLALPFLRAWIGVPDRLAVLLRLNCLAGAARAEIMRHTAPDVYVLPNRPSFTGAGTDSIDYAWFVWSRDPRERGSLRVLRPLSRAERQGSEDLAARLYRGRQ